MSQRLLKERPNAAPINLCFFPTYSIRELPSSDWTTLTPDILHKLNQNGTGPVPCSFRVALDQIHFPRPTAIAGAFAKEVRLIPDLRIRVCASRWGLKSFYQIAV